MKYLLLAACLCITGMSCKKFLDAKPDKALVVPASLQDVQRLLNDFKTFNQSYPYMGGESDDDFYLTANSYNSITVASRNNYTWEGSNNNNGEWVNLYRMVLTANVIIETCDNAAKNEADISEWDAAKGAALFHRANAFYHLAQYFAKPYEAENAASEAGIPLRISSSINAVTQRATVKQTWDRIIADTEAAADLLPANVDMPYQPGRAAAYALLARSYLVMAAYTKALNAAITALSINSTLMDYNALNVNAPYPVQRFNTEVIFHSTPISTGTLNQNHWKVNEELYDSYSANDLRKVIFFKNNGNGSFTFKGDYNNQDPVNPGLHFNGITTAEMYLTAAECYARIGDVSNALNYINRLNVKRYKTGTYTPVQAGSAAEALQLVLKERRKEQVLRYTRWFDLRRLNLEPSTAKTLERVINGQQYVLPPNDNRYTFLIPQEVIAASGIAQNPR